MGKRLSGSHYYRKEVDQFIVTKAAPWVAGLALSHMLPSPTTLDIYPSSTFCLKSGRDGG